MLESSKFCFHAKNMSVKVEDRLQQIQMGSPIHYPVLIRLIIKQMCPGYLLCASWVLRA